MWEIVSYPGRDMFEECCFRFTQEFWFKNCAISKREETIPGKVASAFLLSSLFLFFSSYSVAGGCPYDKQRMAGLLTFSDKTNPKGSFVMNTRMPTGKTANLLSAMKLINAIRLGECKVTEEDVRRAGDLGKALKSIVGLDNDRYYRLFTKLRSVAREAVITSQH